jgi:hypothetical protein
MLEIINSPVAKQKIIERCGEDPISDGLQCPNCGCNETYKNAQDPKDTNQWAFMIRAFRVDDASECMNCKNWFTL